MRELPTAYQQVIHRSRYARWLAEEQRRETWPETVHRYVDFMVDHLFRNHGFTVDPMTEAEVRNAILDLEVMPSMRAMMTAGPALERDNIAGFNCAYLAIDDVRAFDETLYILMCGTGVGFSVERQEVAKLPKVPSEFRHIDDVIVVSDSKMGWAKGFRKLVAALYAGEIPEYDMSKIRPAGARLKVFGGRASGPDPLISLFEFTINLFKSARGRQLTSEECHDLICKIAEIVVVGGVRRAALISLSNLSDQRMRAAKSGEWWRAAPHRALANNSVAYTEKPDVGQFMAEWNALYQSKSGERGMFNRAGVQAKAEYQGRVVHEFGTNPCGEIILRSMQFCNLTEIVARATDTMEDLERKARIAAILGTWQSTLTNYRYIRSQWKRNSEEERLLGVSITGIMDCPLLQPNAEGLEERLLFLRSECQLANYKLADEIGINRSAAITCVKPSGTVSQLVDAASGIHKRFAPKYIRRIRNDVKDPLTPFLVDQGVNAELDLMNDQNMVFAFPMEAPEGSDMHEYTAIEQLEFWLKYATFWTDHNPSTTVYVEEHEWPGVGAWVWENFDQIGGLSFLPKDGGSYRQMPYQAVQKHTVKDVESIDWTALVEADDQTSGSQELACQGGSCEWSA